jgi:hypothetical protein
VPAGRRIVYRLFLVRAISGFRMVEVAGPQVTRDDCNLEQTTKLTVLLTPE